MPENTPLKYTTSLTDNTGDYYSSQPFFLESLRLNENTSLPIAARAQALRTAAADGAGQAAPSERLRPRPRKPQDSRCLRTCQSDQGLF